MLNVKGWTMYSYVVLGWKYSQKAIDHAVETACKIVFQQSLEIRLCWLGGMSSENRSFKHSPTEEELQCAICVRSDCRWTLKESEWGDRYTDISEKYQPIQYWYWYKPVLESWSPSQWPGGTSRTVWHVLGLCDQVLGLGRDLCNISTLNHSVTTDLVTHVVQLHVYY